MYGCIKRIVPRSSHTLMCRCITHTLARSLYMKSGMEFLDVHAEAHINSAHNGNMKLR